MSVLQDNIAKATAYLAHFRDTGVLNHIDGQSVPAASGQTFETVTPTDLSVLATVARGGAEDIDRAVAAAKRADDAEAEKTARAAVHEAKVALGERGPVWWDDGAPDYTRKLVENTPYAQ